MKKGLLLFILWSKALFCFAQNSSEKLIYQLVTSILDEQRQEKIRRFKEQVAYGRIFWPDGPYHPTDTLPKTQLLLSSTYSDSTTYSKLFKEYNSELIKKYLSQKDITYIKQQILHADEFIFDKGKIKLDKIRILPVADLIELRERLSKTEYILNDSLYQRYGSPFFRRFRVSTPLFSLNSKYAVIDIFQGHRSDLCLYKRVGNRWYRIEELGTVIYD